MMPLLLASFLVALTACGTGKEISEKVEFETDAYKKTGCLIKP